MNDRNQPNMTAPASPTAPAPPPPARPASENKSSVAENIQQLGQTTTPAVDSNIFCLTIIGQVEGHVVLPPQNKTTKYEHIIPQLVAAEQNPKIEGILIILNTVGGDVEAGLAIAEMIAHYPNLR